MKKIFYKKYLKKNEKEFIIELRLKWGRIFDFFEKIQLCFIVTYKTAF